VHDPLADARLPTTASRIEALRRLPCARRQFRSSWR